MSFVLPKFTPPDFNSKIFQDSNEIKFGEVTKNGVAPSGFYLTSHMPTYYNYNNSWKIPKRNSQNCVAVVQGNEIVIKELNDLIIGERVVLGKEAIVENGIYIHREGFDQSVASEPIRFVESSFTGDYDYLIELMRHEKENGGHILWVLGPSVVFDYYTRIGLSELAENGYVQGLLAGNAMATHDLEAGYIDTALGQNIYTQESMPMGHYNHLDLLNEVRRSGSIRDFIKEGNVKDGFIKTIDKLDIPYVLVGSIRDDGPLPEVYTNIPQGLNAMKEQTDKATLIIGLATMLHSVSAAELASSYRVKEDGSIVPVFMYSVDVTENVVNKVMAAREYIAVKPVVTNVQDFVVNVQRGLIK
ncbi:fused N-dimethylarginine dimethylaminohydrolase/saccharopine dehydrogenase domain-containing protein [Proteocatella sphenisci]|uniref:fused N-dimethylarginine dimethylaminohydrolase/saccharopine dehydrogenase domain-containing protein n=1 Tax=Proteocatella sphenisci TaxID=181070 RepID=UPI0004910E44|nr:fused N-dimethylarginine dimethylaminohydrolase/saccharopine dehydrogenase domain-containing protein [Proteocatella sphenisci]